MTSCGWRRRSSNGSNTPQYAPYGPRAHARSGDRVAIAAHLGSGKSFDNAIVSFSECYADQNQRDFEALQRAVANGRIVVREGGVMGESPDEGEDFRDREP